jgi:hypothetical protein
MRMLLAWLGPLVMAALLVHCALGHGEEWTFGRLGMPETLLDADGNRYADGREIDSVSLAIARSGYEQEIWLAAVVVLVVLVAVLVLEMRHQHHVRIDVMRRELRHYYGWPAKETP